MDRQLQLWSNTTPFQPQLPHANSTEDSPPQKTTKKKRVYKKRKATNTIRKEQKSALQQEVEELQKQLDAIKLQAFSHEDEASMIVRTWQNAALRESIHEQHLAIAQVRALLSGHSMHGMSGLRPMETRICLSADRQERRTVLHKLRVAKIREAKKFLCARSHGMRPTTAYFQEERYETEEGDFCVGRFEITPLCGVKGGVRAVFDAVLQAAYNAEIIISETSGNITIREDDDVNDDAVVQMRLVSQTAGGRLLDSNLVQFAELSDGESGESYAVVATDFVDEDELYPYRPQERVRRDVTAAMLVTSYLKNGVNCEPTHGTGVQTSEGEGERVVVMSRLFCARVCHTELDLSDQAQLEVRDASVRYASNFVNCLRDILGLPNKCS